MAKQNASTQTKPNILVIWGDDIGIANLSCYSDGVMGYRTPNIGQLAKEGMKFTDSYGEQSCTAGRASFITGQSGYRTGLTKVGVSAAPVGLQAEDPTIAELLKPHGYATGQFGKNHHDKNVGELLNLLDELGIADNTSNTYYDWFLYHDYIALIAQVIVTPFLETFKAFPPRQKAASFTIDQALEKMASAAGGAGR